MKIMIDECVAPKSARLFIKALELHKPPMEAYFLEDWARALDGNQSGDKLPLRGALDSDWSAILQQQGDWAVVSCDNGKARGEVARTKGPPLHLILPARKITGFFLGGTISSRSGFEKIRAIYCVFPEIIEAYDKSTPGTRYKIMAHGSGYRLATWPLGNNDQLPDLDSS